MGKRIISQRRGRGTPRYRSPKHKFRSQVFMIRENRETVNGKIVDIIHSRAHSAPLAKVQYENDECSYIPAPEGVRVNEAVVAGAAAEASVVKPGHILQLKDVPEGTEIYNIEAQPGDGGKFVRTSGVTARVVAKYAKNVEVLMPSKKKKSFNPLCRACIGVIAGGGRLEKPFLKAGTRHHKMKTRNKLYPKVSGTSMNAVDHPYGTSRSSKKGRPTTARKNAPPGAKVGKIRARRTGRKSGKRR